MHSLIHDLKFAFRVIRKNRLTSAVIVATLALGIAGNTAMFAAFEAWVLRPLDFDQPERLVALNEARPKLGLDRGAVSVANLRDWQAEARSFETISAYSRHVFNLHDEDAPESVEGVRVEASLFPMLGAEPVLGRGFLAQEDVPNGPAVALISHQLWQRKLSSDPGVIGSTVRLDGRVHEVIGVMPPGFEFPEWAHLWTPLAQGSGIGERDQRWLSTVGRLRPGISLEDAQVEMSGLGERLAKQYPRSNTGWSVVVRPLREQWAPPVIRLALSASIIAASFVLLVICANVANLMLAQATGRQRELAMRSALGASRRRLVSQMVLESLLLALGGGLLGTVLAGWWMEWMLAWAPVQAPYLFRFTSDFQALIYTVIISIVSGVICALAPVWRSSGMDVVETLKGGGQRSVVAGGGRRMRNGLVVAELAISMLLVIGALLMVKSFLREQRIEPGYRTAEVFTLRLSFTNKAYQDDQKRGIFLDQALTRLAALTEVDSVGAASHLPVSQSGYSGVRVEAVGRPAQAGEEPLAAVSSVTRSYLESLDIQVSAGRDFTRGETLEGGEVALISHSLAKLLWPQGEALEQRIRWHGDPDASWLRVIGVVGDIDPGHSMVSSDWPRQQIYVPYGQASTEAVSFVMRSTAPLDILAPAVRRELFALDPTAAFSSVDTLDHAIERVHWVSSFFSQLFSLYAAIGLAIAALGVYGVTADSVSRRTREMGVRSTLGARPGDLMRLVIGKGLGLGLFGVALGVLLAIPATRLMSTLLFEVSANDPMVFAAVSLALTGIAMLAAYFPARRAARVDPMVVLRFE